MLFKRRIAQSSYDKLRNLIWPKMSFKRVFNYYKHRTVRIPDGEKAIARGLAFGCLVSWTPTFGTHLLQCLVFCWLTRSNWIASFLGSGFGNPWTTPMLMLIAYHVGKALFVATGHGDFIALSNDAHDTFGGFLKSILHGDITWTLISANFKTYLLPTLIGGYTMGLATYPLFYYPTYFMVKGARAARRARIENKVHQEALEMTGQGEDA